MSSLEQEAKLFPIVAEYAKLLHLDNKSEDSSFLSEDQVEVILKFQIGNQSIKPMT